MTAYPRPVMIAPSTSAGSHSFGLLMQKRGATIRDMYEARTITVKGPSKRVRQ